MNKFIRVIALQCVILHAMTAPSHDSGGHEPLMAIPDVGSFSKLQYAKSQLLDLGEYTKGELPEKVIKITKTYAVKVPQPYPVKIKQNIPVPYPVAHPYPVTVPKIVKVPHPVPVEVIKKVEIPVPVHAHHHYAVPSNDYQQQQEYDQGEHQDTSGGYSENGNQGVEGHAGQQLVQFRYNENFGSENEQQEGAGSEPVYQQQQQEQQQQNLYAAYPVNDVQQPQNYGPIQVSHHGIQDGVAGYSIHTVSMNIPQPQEQQVQQEYQQQQTTGGESDENQQQSNEEQHR